MFNNPSLVILHLSLINNIGPSLVMRLVSHLGMDNLPQLYDLSLFDLMNIFGLSLEVAQEVHDGLANKELLEGELARMEEHNISWLTLYSSQYPDLLKNIHVPPAVIFWQGILPTTQSTIAIVGSRDAHSYAQEVIDQLVPTLVQHDWVIVSGGAKGADTMAHKATLEAQGITVAVLGSGLLQPYPPENIRLFEQIVAQGGAVLSPFASLMKPLARNFPARNRVIAGLSRGCIVVQAANVSGARITADYCLSQGREVFAIPGSINDPLSVGCHELIQAGAKLTTCAGDILAEFGQEVLEQRSLIIPQVYSARTTKNSVIIEEDTSVEGVIVKACKQPCSIDELLQITNLPLIEMTKVLFDMQLKRKICQNMAGLWEKQ